jgi:hypothetical protein
MTVQVENVSAEHWNYYPLVIYIHKAAFCVCVCLGQKISQDLWLVHSLKGEMTNEGSTKISINKYLIIFNI